MSIHEAGEERKKGGTVNQKMDSTKRQSITAEQKELLTEFIRKNGKLQCPKFDSTFTFKDSQNLWQQISGVLNSVPGVKNWKLWRKTWQGLRSKGKKLKAQLTRERGTTGGGPPPTVNLDVNLDALISETEACGDSQPKESSVIFDFMERIQTNGYSLKLPVEDPLHIRNDKPTEENNNESNIQLEKGKTTTTSRTNTPKKKFSIPARQLNKSIAETQKLVNVAEKTWPCKNVTTRKRLKYIRN